MKCPLRHVGVTTGPRLSALSVNSGLANSSVPVTIIGANLGGVTFAIAPVGCNCPASVAVAGTEITATLNVAAHRHPGSIRHQSQQFPAGTSGGLGFHVLPPAPSLTSCHSR